MLNEYCAAVYGLTNGYMAAWNEQGGIGPAGLSTEDLHVLDLTQAKPRWHRVVVQGPGPGPRYGHVMALVGQRFLVCTSGNDGKRPLADVWALDTAAKPYEWRKLDPEGDGPPPCMYVIAFDFYKNAWVLYFSSLNFFFCYYSSSRSIFYLCRCALGSFL
jgi:hypothetical protein